MVATDGGGVPEIVVDGGTGILVPPGDVRATADAIARLLADPEAARAMGRAGRRRVRDHFTIEGTAATIQATYAAVLDRAGGRPARG